MTELKSISHKEFNAFIKGKGFANRNDYKLKDLKAMFGFNPLVDRRKLVISAKDIEPITFNSMRKAAKTLGVGERVIRYAKENNRDSFKRTVGNGHTTIFFMKQPRRAMTEKELECMKAGISISTPLFQSGKSLNRVSAALLCILM